jgi:hypothetical protein
MAFKFLILKYILLIKFCSSIKIMYLKSIDLFLKHQQIKSKCLEEFYALRQECNELNKDFTDLNDSLDLILSDFDRENYMKKNIFINEIKSKCIKKYKNHMDQQVRIFKYF